MPFLPPSSALQGDAVQASLASSGLGSIDTNDGLGRGIVDRAMNGELEAKRGNGQRSQITLESSETTLARGERIAKALDQIRMEMTDSADEAASEQQVVVSAAEGAMIAASLGWLAALLRGGSLAALAFSSLPLWRGVDPLAILALSDEERERLEEDLRKAEEHEDDNEKAVGDLLDDR